MLEDTLKMFSSSLYLNKKKVYQNIANVCKSPVFIVTFSLINLFIFENPVTLWKPFHAALLKERGKSCIHKTKVAETEFLPIGLGGCH